MGCLIKALMETAKLEVHDPLRSNHINESKDDKISMDSIKEASSVFLLSFGLLLMLLKRFEVHVISEVPDTPSQLKIHCKSSDKDLGVQLNNGQDFRWSLRENFFGTILYFCRFWWNTLERHCQRQEELWLCVWSVRPDGFYLGNGIWHILWTLMKRRELRYNSFRKNLRGNHYQQHMQTIFNFFSSPVRRIIFGPSKICEELDIN